MNKNFDQMFTELPDDVKEAMVSIDTVQILKGIQEKHRLHIDQTGELSGEIAMIMIGAVPPQRFIANIQKSLNIDKATATSIATDVNEGIFKKVRTSLMHIHQMDAEKNYQEEKKEGEKPKVEEVKKENVDPYREAV